MTTLGAILAALEAVLGGLAGPVVLRNADRPEEVPVGGLVILRDGAHVDDEAMFSPLRYQIRHEAEILIAGADEAERETLIADTVAALIADRTLGGLVQWLEPQAPARDLAELEGAEAPRTATVGVLIHFEAESLA